MKIIKPAGIKYSHLQILVDDEDYDRLSKYRWYVLRKSRGTTNYQNYYACAYVKINGKRETLMMHRVVLGEHGLRIDHVNHNGLDNQKHNLRRCDGSQNQGNSRKRFLLNGKKTSSQYKGVWWHKKNKIWIAECAKKKLGVFQSEESAAMAYDSAALSYFGEFAFLNFPKKMTLTGQSDSKGNLVG